MKLEVNISKGNLFVAIAFLAIIGAMFFAYAGISDTSAPNHPGDQIRVSSGDYMDDSVDQAIDDLDSRLDNLESFSAGDIIVASSPQLVRMPVTAGTMDRDYSTVKTFSVGSSGNIRLEFQYRTQTKKRKVGVRIEKVNSDGSSSIIKGPIIYQSNTAWQDFSEDIAVDAGDTINIQLAALEYSYSEGGSFPTTTYYEYGATNIRNAKVKISNTVPVVSFA